MQCPRRDSGSAGAKNVLDTLENDTKANFQENNPCKVRFTKRREGGMCPPPSGPPPPQLVMGPLMSTKKYQSMTVKQHQYTPGNHKQRELFVLL